MARGELVGGSWSYGGLIASGFSCKKITLFVCFLNILIALYFLRSFYASSLHIYSSNENVVKHTPEQIWKMKESIQIRRSKEPVHLVKLVKKLKQEFSPEEASIELSPMVKRRITDEILQRLRSLDENSSITRQRGHIN